MSRSHDISCLDCVPELADLCNNGSQTRRNSGGVTVLIKLPAARQDSPSTVAEPGARPSFVLKLCGFERPSSKTAILFDTVRRKSAPSRLS